MSQRSCSVRCRFFDVLRDQRDTDTEAPSPSPSMARVVVPVVPPLLPGGPPASKIARNAGKGYMLSTLQHWKYYCSQGRSGLQFAGLRGSVATTERRRGRMLLRFSISSEASRINEVESTKTKTAQSTDSRAQGPGCKSRSKGRDTLVYCLSATIDCTSSSLADTSEI